MLDIKKHQDGKKLTVELIGRLDTATSQRFQKEMKQYLEGIEELILDINDLDYISSSGLRVLLLAQKIMNKQGKMIITNVSDEVREIFKVTGFSDILTIE